MTGFPQVGHALLGKRCADDIAGQVLHGFLTPGQNPRPAVYVEPHMPPLVHQRDNIRADLALERKKPFFNFKSTLADYPDTQKKFFEYKDIRLKEILKDRLAECGYELEEKTIQKSDEH